MSRMENRRKGDAPSSLLSGTLPPRCSPGDSRSPAHLGRAGRFAQSTDSNVNLIRGTTPADTPHGRLTGQVTVGSPGDSEVTRQAGPLRLPTPR